MYRSIVLLVAGLASLGAISLSAQDAVLSQQYGSGVHSYFAGNYAKAYEQLTTAIDGGLKDPRALYFRGFGLLGFWAARKTPSWISAPTPCWRPTT